MYVIIVLNYCLFFLLDFGKTERKFSFVRTCFFPGLALALIMFPLSL